MNRNPGLTHGAESKNVAAKFSDKRTGRGRALHEAIKALTSHFGGPQNVTSPMRLLIDSCIRPKLIVLICISDWVNVQAKLVSSTGELPNVLSKSFIAYTNSLRLDLRELCTMAKDGGSNIKPPSIDELIGGSMGE